MQLLMASPTEYYCFSAFGCHELLPEGFSFCNVFEFPYVVDLKWSLPRFTVFALIAVEPLDNFGAAECPDIDVRLLVNSWVAWQWWSEVFETEHSNDAGLLFSWDGEGLSIVRL